MNQNEALKAAIAAIKDGNGSNIETTTLQQELFEALISSQAYDFGLSREETLDGFISGSMDRGFFPQLASDFSIVPLIGA